jgi:2-isopropylmalate synthase
MGEAAVEEEKIISLEELAVMTGTRMIPTASVRVILDGKDFSSAQTGVGPVDAAMKAVQTITSSIVNVNLKEYRLEALTGGSNAVAEVIIKVEDVDGNSVSSRSAHEDIVKASVNAMITGINKLLLKRRLHTKD